MSISSDGSPAPERQGPRGRKRGARIARRADPEALKRTLRRTFGLKALRAGQEEVIANVLGGKDTLAVMPTGAGKSLCYQVPALHLAGTTVVVSPLIALMKDQADRLDGNGVLVAQDNSALGARAEADAVARVGRGAASIVFTTPERLTQPAFLGALRRNRVGLFVVDEAHCISEWGHDFRPAYLDLGHVLKALGDPPVLALTATATGAVAEDIAKQLDRPRMRMINASIYRDNLEYAVEMTDGDGAKLAALQGIVERQDGTGIVYAATVANAERVHAALRAAGVPVALYHGELGARERREAQDAFMTGGVRLMVATNAFGLGIDKPDVRFVVHYQIPASLEAYYQESGRAGRDGKAAHCVLLYDRKDKRVQQFFLIRRYPVDAEIHAVHRKLAELGAVERGVGFDEVRASVAPIGANKLKVVLKLLKDSGIVRRSGTRRYRLAEANAPRDVLAGLARDYLARGQGDYEKLERMIFYAQTGLCRWRVLLEYFGETPSFERCGKCDGCRRAAARTAGAPVRSGAADGVASRRRMTRPLSAGDAVGVPRFGTGRVQWTAGDEITVEFPDGAVRTFLRGYVRRRRAPPTAPIAGARRPDGTAAELPARDGTARPPGSVAVSAAPPGD